MRGLNIPRPFLMQIPMVDDELRKAAGEEKEGNLKQFIKFYRLIVI